VISPDDIDLMHFVETAEEALAIAQDFCAEGGR